MVSLLILCLPSTLFTTAFTLHLTDYSHDRNRNGRPHGSSGHRDLREAVPYKTQYIRPSPSQNIPIDDPRLKKQFHEEQVTVIGGNADDVKIVWTVGVADGRYPKDSFVYVKKTSEGKDAWVAHEGESTSYCNEEDPRGGESDCRGGASYKRDACHYCSDLIFSAHAKKLEPSTSYQYKFYASTTSTNSTFPHNPSTFTFRTPPKTGDSRPFTFGVVGDLGQTSDSVITAQHLRVHDPDVILFVGDISYADGYGKRWDSYARLMEPTFANVITSFGVGNHDVYSSTDNGLSFEHRFPTNHLMKRSGSSNRTYYSYNAGLTHIIALNNYATNGPDSLQYRWLIADLEEVDSQLTPWIIVFVHAPWYCSNAHHRREGSGMREHLEPIFLQYGVDIVFHGHVHAYERTKPIKDGQVHCNGITYITIGDGGNREGAAEGWLDEPWSAYKESSFGSGTLTVNNATTATWNWFRNQKDAVNADHHDIINRRNACSTRVPEAAAAAEYKIYEIIE